MTNFQDIQKEEKTTLENLLDVEKREGGIEDDPSLG